MHPNYLKIKNEMTCIPIYTVEKGLTESNSMIWTTTSESSLIESKLEIYNKQKQLLKTLTIGNGIVIQGQKLTFDLTFMQVYDKGNYNIKYTLPTVSNDKMFIRVE